MDRVCFTYIARFQHPDTNNVQFYYGSRTKRGCHPGELGTIYPSSSRDLKKLLREHGPDSVTWRVDQIFDGDYELCLLYEHEMIDMLEAVRHKATRENNTTWINRGNGHPKTGHVRSESSKLKMSASMKGRPKSPEHRAKFSAIMKGRPQHPNTAAALRKANLERTYDPETIARGAAKRRGQKRSPEACERMRIAVLNRKSRSKPDQLFALGIS
jgi:hypothetical protein